MIMVCPDSPAMPRESMALGAFVSEKLRMASAIPGISVSITCRVASGVISRGPMPVPPVVKMKSTFLSAGLSLAGRIVREGKGLPAGFPVRRDHFCPHKLPARPGH